MYLHHEMAIKGDTCIYTSKWQSNDIHISTTETAALEFIDRMFKVLDFGELPIVIFLIYKRLLTHWITVFSSHIKLLILDKTPQISQDKINTHSYSRFSNYIRTYFISQYSEL